MRGRLPLLDLPGQVDDESFVIASVSPEIHYPDRPNVRRGGHLVLVHGRDDDGVFFHNPSGVEPFQTDAYVELATFGRFYAQRGVQIRRARQGAGKSM